MLKTRILSSFIFAPLLFWVVWTGGFAMEFVCSGLALAMLWEYLRMTSSNEACYLKIMAYLSGIAVMGALYGWIQAPYIHVILPITTISLWLGSLAQPVPMVTAVHRIAMIGMGVVYCCGLLPFLANLRMFPVHGLTLSLLALFCTWGGDTSAYFVGRMLGKHKLYPIISPKKTVEGAAGGILGGIAMAFLVQLILSYFVEVQLPSVHLALMGAIAAIAGIPGDLSASMLKRSTDTKDSSALIPGHGGILDRFDGVMFAAPSIYLYAIFFLS